MTISFPLATTCGLECEARAVACNQWQVDVYVPPVSSSPVVRSSSGCPCPSPLERRTITTVTPNHHTPIVNTVCALTANIEPECTTLWQSSAAQQHQHNELAVAVVCRLVDNNNLIILSVFHAPLSQRLRGSMPDIRFHNNIWTKP